MKKEPIWLDKPTEVNIGNDVDGTEVCVGGQSVIINKLYGPACFSCLRVTPVVEKDWCWKIEMMNNATGEYEEMLRLRHEICYTPDKDEQ